MTRRFTPTIGLLLVLSGTPAAMEVEARIIKVDADKGTVILQVRDQERTLKIEANAKVVDADGKELPNGLRAKGLSGATATVTIDRDGGEPIVRAIQLGKKLAPPTEGPGMRVDTSKLKSLTELGEGNYQGFMGGLYPGGKNNRPSDHEVAGLALAKKIQPLDAEEKPSAEGRIVVMSVGMSNTFQVFAGFKELADADKEKNPRVLLLNGAQGGMAAADMHDPESLSGRAYWKQVDALLKQNNVTRAQVQVVWLKQANRAGVGGKFPNHAELLQKQLVKIVQQVTNRFPNVKLAYLSSRTYGGYAFPPIGWEPGSFEQGFAVKWLIERQLQSDATLNYDPSKGPVKAPWLSWGPYLWVNGAAKRADGYFAEREDFAKDGGHHSKTGYLKVGRLLLEFFKTDSTTKGWFVAP